MKFPSTLLFLAAWLPVFANEAPTALPPVTVYSPRIANQAPAATFAMPVSALRYEPRVDLQGRNLVEGQADVTLRGGIFESTGFRIGVLSLLDPQTGHYFAEIPIAPQMIGAPEVITGPTQAFMTTNATVGAISYEWRPIASTGVAQVGFGPHGLWRGDLYQGVVGGLGRGRLGLDVAIAHSESDGPIAFGDHRFDRLNGRLEFGVPASRTTLFAGYQAKFFGWPNLYTPFNSNESENLETVLVALNHRLDLGGGDYAEVGAYHRRNKDDYAFNRLASVGTVHPFQHTTWLDAVAIEGRNTVGGFTVASRAEVLADHLKSTSLTAGRFRSRTLWKAGIVPERAWPVASGGSWRLKAGATYEDSDRDAGSLSPVAELAREFSGAGVRRLFVSYAKATQLPTYTALNSSATSGLFRGNAGLGRETAHNLEAGASALVSGWTLDGALFARRDRSLVDWTFRRGVTARFANAVDIDTAGVEFVARRSWRVLDITLGYTGLTKDSDYRGAPVDASFYALNYARHRATLATTVRLPRGFELRIDNVIRRQAPNFLRTIGGRSAVSSTVALAYRPVAVRGLEFTVHLDNAWNSRFQEIPAVPASPRQWSAGASYVW